MVRGRAVPCASSCFVRVQGSEPLGGGAERAKAEKCPEAWGPPPATGKGLQDQSLPTQLWLSHLLWRPLEHCARVHDPVLAPSQPLSLGLRFTVCLLHSWESSVSRPQLPLQPPTGAQPAGSTDEAPKRNLSLMQVYPAFLTAVCNSHVVINVLPATLGPF